MNNLEIKVNQILWQLLGIEPSDELKEQIEQEQNNEHGR